MRKTGDLVLDFICNPDTTYKSDELQYKRQICTKQIRIIGYKSATKHKYTRHCNATTNNLHLTILISEKNYEDHQNQNKIA